MDYSTFCREIFTIVSSRLPLHLQAETDLRNLPHQGGWHYPSSRDKNAYFFDLAQAYRHYVSGMDLKLVADALEAGFFRKQWADTLPQEEATLSSSHALAVALRVRPREERILLPPSTYYLCWNQYIWEPCGCRHPALDYSSFLPEYAPKAYQEEEAFWQFFWKRLVRQDPPALYALTTPYQIREITFTKTKKRALRPIPPPAYVLTSRKHQYGAAVLFYPGLLGRLHQYFSDYYLLMASPHALMLYPGNSPYLQDSLLLTLRQIMKSNAGPGGFPPALYQYTVERGLTSC